MKSSHLALLISALVLLLGAAIAQAGTVYVVGHNPGDAATIAAGTTKLQPGDTLDIMPGTYHEGIVVPCDNVTIEGKGPGVVLDGTQRVTATDFTSAADRPGVYIWSLPAKASAGAGWIFYNDQMLICRTKPLDPAKDQMCFFFNEDKRQLELNINGKDIPANARIEVPVIATLVEINKHNNVTIKGLTLLRAAGTTVGAWGSNDLDLEYCVIRQCEQGINGGHRAHIAHNTITLCDDDATFNDDSSTESLIEENLAVANAINWSENEHWAGNFKQNGGARCVYRQNWVMDSLTDPVKVGPQTKYFTQCYATGIWSDTDSFSNTVQGNCVARFPMAGIYVEYGDTRKVIMYNTVQDCAMGITFRHSYNNLVSRNWIFDRSYLGWGKTDTHGFAAFGRGVGPDGKPFHVYDNPALYGQQFLEGICLWDAVHGGGSYTHDNAVTHNLIQVSGRAVSVPRQGQGWPTKRQLAQDPPPMPLSNQLAANYYDRPAQDSNFALLDSKVVDFNAYRKASNWDLNAKEGQFTPAVLGMEALWTIPWAALQQDIPVAIMYDPSLETPSTSGTGEPMFWHGSNVIADWLYYCPLTRYMSDDKAHSGDYYIMAANQATAKADATWTSTTIPVKPGITMGVDLWANAEKVAPGAGVFAVMRYLDATGNLVGEKYLIGTDDHAQLQSGSYAWSNVKAQAEAPANACWLKVELGLHPLDGLVRFDDIHINMVNPVPPSFASKK